jgi:hypothetical protein
VTWPVCPVLGHRLVAVGRSENPGSRAELGGGETLAVPRPVGPLVVAGRERVQRAQGARPHHLGRGEPSPLAGPGRQRGDLTRVPRRKWRLEVDEVGRDLQGAVQVLAAQHPAGPGLGGEYRVPRIELVQTAEELGGDRQELRDQCGIVGAARPLPDQRDRLGR